MYKYWIKTIGLSILVVSTALFLELGVSNDDYIMASSFNSDGFETKIFDLKYRNFDLDTRDNVQNLSKVRYVSKKLKTEEALTKEISHLRYYPGLSAMKVVEDSFFWDNIMQPKNRNAIESDDSYDDKDFEFFKYSIGKKELKKDLEATNVIWKKRKECTLTDVKMQDGESGNFYSQKTVPVGTSCDLYLKERVCDDGILLGEKKYKYTRCDQDEPVDCTLNGHKVLHGKSKIFYKRTGASFRETCEDLSQRRSCANGKMNGDSEYNKLGCTSVMDESCFFLGERIDTNENSIFYQTPVVDFGEECKLQVRSCIDGKLSGRYEYKDCFTQAPENCHLGLTFINHGDAKLFYKDSFLPYGGVCESQERACDQGVISGDDIYKESFCRVESPKNCQVGNVMLLHGETKSFYSFSNALLGQNCIAQERTCNDGKVSGSDLYANTTCKPYAKKTCSLDGVFMKDGAFVDFYKKSKVLHNEKCESVTRKCEDGVMMGDSEYNKSSCTEFESCSFRDQIINSNASRIFYKQGLIPSGKCEAELRTCIDGDLSGTFNSLSCFVESEEHCLFSEQTIEEGASKVFYSTEKVPYGSKCENYSKPKFCINGRVKDETKYVYSTCEVEEKPVIEDKDCSFREETIKNRESKIYYKSAEVPYGKTCEFERRVCREGTLFGTYKYKTCSVEERESCLIGGKEIKDGETKVFYSKSHASEDESCSLYKQRRTCVDGVLSGDDFHHWGSCKDYEKKSCLLDDVTVEDGDSYTFYTNATIAEGDSCEGQIRKCEDGVFTGEEDYEYASCRQLKSCRFGDDIIEPNDTRVFYNNNNVFDKMNCRTETRTCYDGELSGSFGNQYCFSRESQTCYFSDIAIPEDSYRVFYSRQTVPKGSDCEDYSRKKYCLSGKVEGEAEYIYSRCSEEK